MLAASVVALATILRAYDLLVLPIFTDEATYLRWSADIFDQRTRMSLFIPVAEDGKQPLFVWMGTLALAAFSEPLLAGRVVSVVAGFFSVIGILAAGHWLEDDLLGLLGATLYAVVPYVLIHDRFALADSWIGATAVWTLALGVFISSRADSSRAALVVGVILGAVMAFGVWAKSTALFVISFPLLCAVLLHRKDWPWWRTIRSLLVAYLVFGALASLLLVMPYADSQLRLLATHVFSPGQLTASLPVQRWLSNAADYWNWVLAYLPMPLYPAVIGSAILGLVSRRRQTVLLLGCWAAVTVPSIMLAQFFSSRYVVHSIFPLLLLVAIAARTIGLGAAGTWGGTIGMASRRTLAASVGFAAVFAASVPSIAFDLQLLTDPPSAPWAASDRIEYIEGWSSGYGFNEALQLALSRAKELEGDVFVLSDHFQGLSHDGLALYMRGIPKVRHHVDGQIAWGGADLANAWRSHGVPLIIVRNDGRFRPEQFEARIPEAELLGIFWKPGGRNSFRVYEMDPREVGSRG